MKLLSVALLVLILIGLQLLLLQTAVLPALDNLQTVYGNADNLAARAAGY